MICRSWIWRFFWLFIYWIKDSSHHEENREVTYVSHDIVSSNENEAMCNRFNDYTLKNEGKKKCSMQLSL